MKDMKKFSKEEERNIEGSREVIQSLLRTQDAVFDLLCEQIGVTDDDDINWLFDYIYNTLGDSSKYTAYVKEKIYGSTQ
jgi:hypothetical protein